MKQPMLLTVVTALSVMLVGCASGVEARIEATSYDGWSALSPREEIRPTFSIEESGGPGGKPALVITADERPGLDGYWEKAIPVAGGRYYEFRAFRKADREGVPPQAILARLTWLTSDGKLADRPADKARPEYPTDLETGTDGWTLVADRFLAPENAAEALVELRFRWVSNATVKWSDFSLVPADPPGPRNVRVAAVHFRPKGGKTMQDNREMFVPLVEEAAAQGADLVVFPEFAMSEGLPGPYEDRAEVVPGPSTEFFGRLAKKHDLYIVVTVLERAGSLIYNIAALVGPEGYLGKYRKVAPARAEYAGGIYAGDEYPVFQTRFGKIGMMICWDLQHPKVAAQLAANGAELIVCPIAGGNPKLAQARAIENQVYVVTSTYTIRSDWMKTGVWDMEGNLVNHTDEWGSVLVQDIDLNHHVQWNHMGDLRRRLLRERPEW